MAKSMLLEDQIRRNQLVTLLICLFMLILLFTVIFLIGFILGAPPLFTFPLAIAIAVAYVLITYSFSVQSVIAAAKARPANPDNRDEKILMYKVDEMATAAGLPPPKVYVQDSHDINAFATGRNPNDAIICATTGAITKLDSEELEGVIGHEMSHILDRDILVMTVTVGVVGAIALISEIVIRMVFWGGAGRSRDERGSGGVILLILAIVFIILAPIFSRLTYLAISRRREYLADAQGARLTRNPEGLAKALEKIKDDLPDDPKGSPTVAPLYIANPFKRGLRDSIWSTHPPLDERIRRLREM